MTALAIFLVDIIDGQAKIIRSIVSTLAALQRKKIAFSLHGFSRNSRAFEKYKDNFEIFSKSSIEYSP